MNETFNEKKHISELNPEISNENGNNENNTSSSCNTKAQSEKLEEIKKSQDRVNVLNKIEEYEQNGWFDRDVEDDPPSRTLQPDEVDY